MDTVHDLPARHDENGRVAQLAQTIAMLAEAMARHRLVTEHRSEDRTVADAEVVGAVDRAAATLDEMRAAGGVEAHVGDALSRYSANESEARARATAAAEDESTPDNPVTPTIDEHQVAAARSEVELGQASHHSAVAKAALAEAREALGQTRQAFALPRSTSSVTQARSAPALPSAPAPRR